MGVVPYWGRQPAAYLAGLYGVHCMSWVVELGPRVLGGWMRQLVKEGISNSGMLWFQCFYFAFDDP